MLYWKLQELFLDISEYMVINCAHHLKGGGIQACFALEAF